MTTKISRAGLVYFVIVFSAGFALGAIRTLWVVPRIGARRAELMELPIMAAVSFFAAQWVVRRLVPPPTRNGRLFIGGFALTLMLLAEFGFVLWVRGLSIRQYWETRDPVSGTAYFVSLVLFAMMPLFVART